MVVYGTEYFFGAGIQQIPAGTAPYGAPLRVIDLGVTHVPKDVFEMYLQEISPRYTPETYSLLTHNCNNFSNEIAQFLVGASIPDYIVNLPNEVMNSPMGALISKILISFLSFSFLVWGRLPNSYRLRAYWVSFTSLGEYGKYRESYPVSEGGDLTNNLLSPSQNKCP